MKIFNWMHRKFNNNILTDGFARNVKKTESIAIDTNTKDLLQQVALADVLDGWRDGILTIGTFGFDPLKRDDQQKGFFFLESEDDNEVQVHDFVNNIDEDDTNVSGDLQDEEEEEEVNPLIFSTFASNIADHHERADDVIIAIDGVKIAPFATGSPTFDVDTSAKKRRTTLAELFNEDSADHHIKKKPSVDDHQFDENDGKRQSVRTKNGPSSAKKLVPHVKEDSRPIKKLHQMMRRMLKRKIHPEVEGKANKSDGQNKACVLEFVGNEHQTAAESVSLLQSPEAIAV